MQQRGPEWDPVTWEEIRTAMREVVERSAIVRQFLPVVVVPDSTSTVNAETWDATTGTVDATSTIPMVEVYRNFRLRPEQVERETTLHEGRGAAIRVARELAIAADKIVLDGKATGLAVKTRPSPVTGQTALLPGSGTAVTAPGAGSSWAEKFIAAVQSALGRLRASGHYGPYAVITTPAVDASIRRLIDGSTVSTLEKLASDISFVGASAALAGVPANQTHPVLLASVGANTMDLCVTDDDFQISFVRVDEDGLHEFRVSHRFVLRLKDDKACTRLNVKP